MATIPYGTLERVINMLAKLVSGVAFGGPALDRLFVSTIAHGSQRNVDVDRGPAVIDGLDARRQSDHSFAG